MKYYEGKDCEYRGYYIRNDKRNRQLKVYDKAGNYLFQVDSFGKGSITAAKFRIDGMIKRFH